MNVYVVTRQDQSEYGYVDVCVEKVFGNKDDAEAYVKAERTKARDDGQQVWGLEPDDQDEDFDESSWDVDWDIEAHEID